ncbi:MAG: hypothetical protein JNK88_02915, partial [Mangrovicoccus sp.]|nr:hypothetical protein [Mangrovicoccus sp.]
RTEAAREATRAAEVSAIESGARAERHERRLHAVIRDRAALLPVPVLHEGDHLRSFFMGGFECASHRRGDRRRLDLTASTGHEAHAAADYRALARHGIRTVRDGLRWHLIETAPGRYDWSSFLPMLRAARETGTQVIWDLAHYGWPDDLDIWSPAFTERFGAFARAAADVIRSETDEVPFYVPVNEISFWAWGGGSVAYINPFTEGRGDELKLALARAALAAIDAVRAVDPRAQIVSAEPAIHIGPRSSSPADIAAARDYSAAQFQAMDLLLGRERPDLGGAPDRVDMVGLNVYIYNQWTDGELTMALDHPDYRPLRNILAEVHRRYGRPVLLAETGIEGDSRAPWLRVMAAEVAAAQQAGVPVAGLCLYPVTDYPGWVDDRYCPTGLLGYPDASGARSVYLPLADELASLHRAMQRRCPG